MDTAPDLGYNRVLGMAPPALTLIGLDAATLDVVRPLAAGGDLPNLARLLEGASGRLRSTTHPLTPHAWVTLATGVNAGEHGVWDFVERDDTGYGLTPINGSYRRAPAVWDHLARSGRSVGLVTVPFTWPAPEVPGFAVSGFDASGERADAVYPAGLGPELEGRFEAYRLDDTSPMTRDGFDLGAVERACEAKVRLTRRLVDEFEPEFVAVVFMAADYVHHACWPDWEERGRESRVADVYRLLDAAVGELTGDGDVMVVSDHGGGSLNGVVSLNGWLADAGFLAYRSPPGLLARAASRLPGRLLERPPAPVVDWPRTKAFAYGMFGNVVVNLRGRERQGVVAPADYDRVRDEIAAGLLALRSADGEAPVEAVHRREDLYEGPYLEKVPDLVVEFADYAWLGTGSLDERSEGIWDPVAARIGARGGWAGSHRLDGLFVLSGPSAAGGVEVSASILDVAPTVLYLLDADVPAALEGRILTEAIAPEIVDGRPPRFTDRVAGDPRGARAYERSAAVEQRLRDLGYLG